MSDEYQTIHGNALKFLEKIIEKSGTFEPKTIVAEGEQLDKLLGKLESSLRARGEEYKAPARMAARIRDIFRIHYWSDISKENWTLIYSGIEKLSEPEKITRESLKEFGKKLLEGNLTWLPVTERAEKDIAEAKKEFKKRYSYIPFEKE